ncbi:MAG: HEAT repeat domain-containing protein [Planctomycetota bacterium]|nr:MAG: HEAT repeat domain-containing protein [Planctomycetota bacterium]
MMESGAALRILLPPILVAAACHAPPPPPQEPPEEIEVPLVPEPSPFDLPGQELRSWISSGHGHIREQAVELAWKAGPDGVATVADLLDDERPEVARAAERALWTLVHHAADPSSPRRRRETAAAIAAEIHRPRSLAAREKLLAALAVAGPGRSAVAEVAAWLDHPGLRPAALRALERMPQPEAGEALAAALARATAEGAAAETRLGLILALGGRQDAAGARELLAVAGDGSEPELARAARRALARSGAAEAAAAFLALASADSPSPAAALDSLRWAQAAAARGRERDARAVEEALLHHSAASVRAGAVAGLAERPGEEIPGLLVAALDDPDPAVRAAARSGLAARPGRLTDKALERAYRDGDDARRAEILRLRVERDGADRAAAADRIAAALASWGPIERLAALELAALRPAEPFVPLLERTRDRGTPEERAAAEKALLACAERRAGEDPQAARELYSSLAEQTEDPAVAAAARAGAFRAWLAAAVVSAAEDPTAAAAELDAIIRAEGVPAAVRRAAGARLAALGEDIGAYAREAGFLTHWWLGPVEARDVRPFLEHPFSIDGPDPLARPQGWRAIDVADLDGILDLRALCEPKEEAAVYLWTRFELPAGQPVLLQLGSDDGVVVWLDNELVHRNEVMRALTPDQDRVPLQLAAGPHSLLVKVTQGGGGWEFCLRLTDPAGRPLALAPAGS